MRYPLSETILSAFPEKDLDTFFSPSLRLHEDDESIVLDVTYKKSHVNLSKAFDQDISDLSEEDQILAIDSFKYAEEKKIKKELSESLGEKFSQGFSSVKVDVSIDYEEPASLAGLTDASIEFTIQLTIQVPIPAIEETLKKEISRFLGQY
jgi:hypothetical protein